MVTVPFYCADTPALKNNPVFMFYEDRFQKPNPFTADVVVATDDVLQKKLDCVEALESQFFEGGCNGADIVLDTEQQRADRKQEVLEAFRNRFAATANRFREQLVSTYGEQAGRAVHSAEAFEICEYGRQPSASELRRLFPFVPPKSN